MVNGCVAVRGAPFDFDRWAAFGNPGWSWEDLLPYFVELENDLFHTSAALHLPTDVGRAREGEQLEARVID